MCQSTSCLASYATAHLGHQFRVHNFCLLVCGEYARFIRWDRDGATVTRRFDYIKEPHLLTDFFWRYAHLYRSQQGYDTSVSSATPERYRTNRALLRDDNHRHAYFDGYFLHRDISVGNITYEGKGLLIAGDLSIGLINPNTCKKLPSARRPNQTVSAHFFAVDLSLTIPQGT